MNGDSPGCERHWLAHPGAFALRTLRAFRANQGLLILIVIGLSRVVDPDELLDTLRRYLEWLVPTQSGPIVAELARFVEHGMGVGWVLLATLVFFSSLAFTVLENAMSVIFFHRVAIRRRHFLVSAILPYCYIVCLGVGLLLITLVWGALEAIGTERFVLLGRAWSLDRLSAVLLYLVGFAGEVCILTSIYLVMPVGRLSVRHALIGALTAGGAVADHAARARVVLRDLVAGERGLRIADDRDRGVDEPRDRGRAAAPRGAGDLGVRAARRIGAPLGAAHRVNSRRAAARGLAQHPFEVFVARRLDQVPIEAGRRGALLVVH